MRLLGVATDISDLVEQADRLARANTLLERYASLAAHDLASPLGTASLMLQMLQLEADRGDNSAVRGSISDVVGVLESSSANISSLLVLQKALLSRRLEREAVDLGDVARRVQARLKASLAAASGAIDIGPLPVLDCNPVLVDTLLQNLIENSIKYRSGDAPVICLRHARSGCQDVISVADNGAGLGDQDRDTLFEIFTQGDARSAGLGLGLSLCKSIVEAHGGRIWIDSQYHGGTKIDFTLTSGADGDAAPPKPIVPQNRLSELCDEIPGLAR